MEEYVCYNIPGNIQLGHFIKYEAEATNYREDMIPDIGLFLQIEIAYK